MDKKDIRFCNLRISDLLPNDGQIEGLPKNPRYISDENFARLKKSIEDDPELLDFRRLGVFPFNGKYVVLDGNMRLKACEELGYKELPCYVFPVETPADKLRAYVIKDNISFGLNDWDALANEWNADELAEWGLDIPIWSADDSDINDENEEEKKEKEKIDSVEKMLCAAMQRNLLECKEQIDYTMQKGWLISGVTAGMIEAKFIRAKYYGERFAQWLSIYWCPQRFFTSANTRSLYEQVCISAEKGEAGIAGFRTTSEDGNVLDTITKGGYPIGGARMPLDFPSDLAKDLIEEFSPKNKPVEVLDPCHGWGGRFVGALLANVKKYVGVDPSEYAHNGLCRCKDIIGKYSDTESEFIKKPFEECELEPESFDIAITSPPYFDVEQYQGEQQAHIKYGNYELWKDKFYSVLIQKTHAALRKGGYFLLQVGSQSYPLKNDGIKFAKKAGFKVCEVRNFGRGTNSKLHEGSAEDGEVIIVLQKN